MCEHWNIPLRSLNAFPQVNENHHGHRYINWCAKKHAKKKKECSQYSHTIKLMRLITRKWLAPGGVSGEKTVGRNKNAKRTLCFTDDSTCRL